jgi:hypothetical protein
MVAMVPPVKEQCPGCKGCGTIEIPHGEINCPNCGNPDDTGTIGSGYTLRQMTSREEHFYILFLLETRYQLR